MTTESDAKRLIAKRQLDPDGNPKAFRLANGHEQIALEPGKTWPQVDSHKWVTRGLMEEPSGFHVLSNGSVQMHGEEIALDDPDGPARLEALINRRVEAVAQKPSRPAAPVAPRAQSASGPSKVKFKVRLDKLGHLMVASFREGERVETGIRGLEGLVRNGLMLKPKTIHIDPLLRYVEIDEARFESSPAGAEALENRLNSSYAPALKGDGHAAIEIRPNAAAASGFDIHFFTSRAGARFEIKGHLSQEHLDVLQDSVKCQLLRPGIVLRLSPPHLIIRRRRSDGGEEKIPELPDVHYLRVTAAELQRILNHPALRRGAGANETQAVAAEQGPAEITEFRIVRNPQSKMFLGMEIRSARGGRTKAFTHHNVSELQHTGVFRSNLEVVLSLDNRTLTVFDNEAHTEERIAIDPSSAENDLQKAAQMMTVALKPVAPPSPVEPVVASVERVQGFGAVVEQPVVAEPATVPVQSSVVIAAAVEAIPISAPVGKTTVASIEPAAAIAESNPEIRGLFCERDPVRINVEIFRRLEACLGIQTQKVSLSLERVFQDREFEILSFTHPEVSDVLEIRSEEFAGFYLSHVNERKVLLDYACAGKRIEWGPTKCRLQASVTSDPEEFSGHALLGMALSEYSQYVFIVTPAFPQWYKTRERFYREIPVSFITVDDLVSAPEKYQLVWPVPSGATEEKREN